MKSPVRQNVFRIDGLEKLTGTAIYTGDLKIPGLAYGKILRSPLAHAWIRRIDSRAAESMTGVLSVLTRDSLKVSFPYYGQFVKDQPVIGLEKVHYAGDIVAAVAATEEGIAEAALNKIEVEYEELPAVFTVEDALDDNAPIIHRQHEGKQPTYGKGASHIVHRNSNICLHFRYERGDIEEGFKTADLICEDTFFFPSAQHYPMEPHICVANFEGESLTVWSSTQSPFPVRQELSNIFGIPLNRVRVIVPYVGGGYGAKGGIKTEALAAALSRMSRRPVRVSFTADETFKTVCQPGAKLTIKTGVKKNGTFVARRCEVYLNGGAYALAGPSVAEKAGYRAHGPYRIPHVLTDAYHVYTNTVPSGAFRGFGATQVVFAYESHLDIISQRLKIDPLELRLKNILNKGEEFGPGDTPIDCDLKAGLMHVAEAIQWDKREGGVEGSEVRRGKGIACAVKDGGGTNKPAHAIVKILYDGSVVLATGSVEIGQGIRTALLQIVAEELSVPPEQVQVAALDSQSTPFDKGTNASSAVVVMGRAVQQAARDARAQLLLAAAQILDVEANSIELENGSVTSNNISLTLREVMRSFLAETEGEILGKGFFKISRNDQAPLGYPSPFWEIGLVAVEVEVDGMTGKVKILRYVSLTDAGKMIHPLQCRGQDEGAAVFGMGLGLSEELVYQDGQLINPNLMDYRIPRFRDLPRVFTTRILEEGGGPGPYGAKGMGEGGILGAAPALSNAVYDAVGVRIHQLPLTGERVWRAVQKSKTERDK